VDQQPSSQRKVCFDITECMYPKTTVDAGANRTLTVYPVRSVVYWFMWNENWDRTLNPSNSHCNGAIRIHPEPKNLKLKFQWKKLWCPFSGTEKTFSWLTACQQLMPLHIVTSWHGFVETFKTKEGECCQAACSCSTQRAATFCIRHHCASGKIQVGYIEPSAVQSRPRAQQFPIVSSPKPSCWEKVQSWWWGARQSHDVVQRAGSRLLWLGDTEAGSKT